MIKNRGHLIFQWSKLVHHVFQWGQFNGKLYKKRRYTIHFQKLTVLGCYLGKEEKCRIIIYVLKKKKHCKKLTL